MAKRNSDKTEPTGDEAKSDKVLVNVYLDKETVDELDELRWTKRIEGSAAVVRMLIEAGLKVVSA